MTSISRVNILLPLAFTMALASGCGKSKAQTDSYLVMSLLQDHQLTYYYTPEQRDSLRRQVEKILK